MNCGSYFSLSVFFKQSWFVNLYERYSSVTAEVVTGSSAWIGRGLSCVCVQRRDSDARPSFDLTPMQVIVSVGSSNNYLIHVRCNVLCFSLGALRCKEYMYERYRLLISVSGLFSLKKQKTILCTACGLFHSLIHDDCTTHFFRKSAQIGFRVGQMLPMMVQSLNIRYIP